MGKLKGVRECYLALAFGGGVDVLIVCASCLTARSFSQRYS